MDTYLCSSVIFFVEADDVDACLFKNQPFQQLLYFSNRVEFSIASPLNSLSWISPCKLVFSNGCQVVHFACMLWAPKSYKEWLISAVWFA